MFLSLIIACLLRILALSPKSFSLNSEIKVHTSGYALYESRSRQNFVPLKGLRQRRRFVVKMKNYGGFAP